MNNKRKICNNDDLKKKLRDCLDDLFKLKAYIEEETQDERITCAHEIDMEIDVELSCHKKQHKILKDETILCIEHSQRKLKVIYEDLERLQIEIDERLEMVQEHLHN